MKKAAFIALCVCIGLVSHAQVALGLSEKEVRSRLTSADKIINYDPGGGTDNNVGAILIVRSFPDYVFTRYYSFRPDNHICYLYVVKPVNQEAEKAFVEHLNNTYVVINPTTWRYYEKGKPVKVSIEYLETEKKNWFTFEME